MIDLDAPGSAAEVPDRRRRFDRRLWKLLAPAALALALTTAAGAPASLEPVLTLPERSVSDVRIDDGTVYVLTAEALTAYRLTDGTRRWTAPSAPGSVLVGTASGRIVTARTDRPVITAYDTATGTRQWQRSGLAPAVHRAAGVVLATTDPNTIPAETGIDVRTGADRWTLSLPPGTTRALIPAGNDLGVTIADLSPTGDLTIRSPASAAVRQTVRLAGTSDFNWFTVHDNRLLTAQTTERNDMFSATVYDLPTGRRLWQRTPTDGRPLWWCGPSLCTGTTTVTVLDPDTGRERWHLEGLAPVAYPDPQHLLATPYTGAYEPDPGIVILDATTGHELRRIREWYLIDTDNRTNPLVANRLPDGGALLGRLNPTTGAVQVLAHAPRWTITPCTTTGERLTCLLDPLTIWRLPAPPPAR